MVKNYKVGVILLTPTNYLGKMKEICLGLGLSYRGKPNISALVNLALDNADPKMIGEWLIAGLTSAEEADNIYRTNVQLTIPNYEKTEAWAKSLDVSQTIFLRLAVIAIVLGVWKHE
jgi:uncharacterized Zn finger protein